MQDISSGKMYSARVATVTAVTFILAFALVLCGRAQKVEAADTGDCSTDPTGEKVVSVTKAETVTLKCNEAHADKVKPAFATVGSQFKVCNDADCSKTLTLSELIGGATGQKQGKASATVKITKLPSTATNFYVLCGGTKSSCYILVKVAQAPSTSDTGPGVSEGEAGSTGGGSPQSCATPGTAITIKIPEKGSTAQFTCGQLTLYPRATDRVFAEDCKKEESLKDITRSDKGNVYTLTAGKKPPKKKWCYLCARSSVSSSHLGQASDYCLVHVESSSRTQSSSAIALAAMVPCVLAMLRIT